MRKSLIYIFLLSIPLWGCGSHRSVLKTSKETTPAPQPTVVPEPPPLTDEQLLGLKHPEDMIEDPISHQVALPEVMHAFWKLKEKAQQDGWHLILVSGYRSFKSQRRIWNESNAQYLKAGETDQKKRVESIMTLVSVPGLSRHHWGTDMDISENSLRGQLIRLNDDTPQKVKDFYQWMAENAPLFGFCQVYLGKSGAVHNEPWHWSYLPFSRTYQKQFMAIEDFKKIMDIDVDEVDYIMKNFKKILNVEKKSINPECFQDSRKN